jgi:hypothetical protein
MSGERCALNRRNPDLLEIAQAGVEFDCDRIIPTARNCDSLGVPKSAKL